MADVATAPKTDEPKPDPMKEAFAKAREAVADAAKPKPPADAPPATETPAEEPPADTPPATPPAGEPPATETPAAEPEAKTETPAPEAIIVELPARRPGEKPLPIKVENEEQAERLRQNVRSAMRRDEFNRAMADVTEQRESLELVQLHLETDPVGFLTDQVKPELQVELVRHLLSIPHVFKAVEPEIQSWEDENVRARRQAELANARTDGRTKAEKQMERMAEAKREGKIIRDTVDAIVPADLTDDELVMLRNDCLGDVSAFVRANPNTRRLRPEEVVDIVQRRLRHYGVTPEMARAALTSGQPVRRPTAASLKAPASGIPDENAARTTGAKLKQEGDARRAAAAVPGAGAGAQPARAEPPPQQGVKERLAWMRKAILGR